MAPAAAGWPNANAGRNINQNAAATAPVLWRI
jgi:hypothetical protein